MGFAMGFAIGYAVGFFMAYPTARPMGVAMGEMSRSMHYEAFHGKIGGMSCRIRQDTSV